MFHKLKKTTGWIILFSVILGIAAPIYYAYAVIGMTPDMYLHIASWATNKLTDMSPTNLLIGGVFSVLTIITSSFLWIAHSLLELVISPGFIDISFTGPDNLIVQEGWGIVRDFTNMFIILGFVIVALATILRIKEYQAQKLLPLLIGIALLINFTPVICGFFIDISNVAMNHFLTAGTLDRSFIETLDYQTKSLVDEDTTSYQKLGEGVLFVGFNIIAGIIFLLFALLFAVRYVALWILIILSPLAFFCYILPETKGAWSMWWKQFFQWCIIGIPAAFFIYLSNITIATIVGKGISPEEVNMISYTIPILFLIIGFFVSLQTGAMGADKITAGFGGAVKKGTAGAGAWAERKVKETAFVKGQSEKWRGRLERIPEKVGTGRMKAEAAAKHQIEREKKIEEAQKLMEPMSVKNREEFKSPTEKLAAFRLAIKEDHLGEWDEKNINTVKRYGTQKDLIDAAKKRPDLAAKLNPEKVDEMMKKKQGISRIEAESQVITEKVQGKQPVKLRQDTQAEAFKSKDVVFSMSEAQVKEVTTRGSGEQKKEIYDTYVKEVKKLTGQSIHYGTTEELREEVGKNTKNIQRQIDILRNTGKPEDAIKSEAIKEITIAIQRRKF
ncbi:hypothetical protein KAT95_03070 [Candidatus Parcubacteria bacterium]|nr:hypothetical protein [Candidatus Parcubacteria bacterium]